MGDLPFMVAADSSDVWSRPAEFRRDRRIGTPPDAFSAEGQDWGLPAYDFQAMAAEGFSWMRARAAQAAAHHGLARLDHVIGMYRTYSRPLDSDEGAFEPDVEAAQLARGETLLGLFAAEGRVVAEDLGLLPDYLRPSLERLGIPGYRVLRWEKGEDGAFRDPALWPVASVATTGTHDIEPVALWWDELPAEERAALVRVPALAGVNPSRPFDAEVRDALLDAVYGAPSVLAIAPLQDLLGTRERVNVPGTVSATNWTMRMTAEALALAQDRDVCARLATLAERHRR
jgi:4-alpha-glucanotransferase